MRKRPILLSTLGAGVLLAGFAYRNPQLAIQTVADVSCVDQIVCTDDPTRMEEATQLYTDAFLFVASSITRLEKKPLVVFCSSESCYQSFGRTKATARTVGGFCIAIGPSGWKPYYVRHEMIHRLQWQQLGVVKMFQVPEWFIEGMAYALSEDPRVKLLEPFQSFRSKFLQWYRTVGKEHLWAEAAKV